MFDLALTDHLEGARDRASPDIFDEVAELIRAADRLGMKYAWFAEHHAHAHFGHLPTPLLFALHLANQTRDIHLGTAIICLNLHPALAVAEQVAVADHLAAGRIAPGFGSGSTPEEVKLFGVTEGAEDERHARFEHALRTIADAWTTLLPTARPDLTARCWVAVNSVGSARIAGLMNFNVLFSHLRTPDQYARYAATYRAAGGTRQLAANRPVFVGPDDATAFAQAEPALRTLWRRFQREGKIPADLPEPTTIDGLCAHPVNFIVGGPDRVAAQLLDLHTQVPFDVANVELRWAGLSHQQVLDSLTRLMRDVVPLL
jgi:alkanesulfonate monooxygenase SsuD/methylene tetrahydromethanopterin reductase-like flavin-dependent oxidoreductase (luciferase family)